LWDSLPNEGVNILLWEEGQIGPLLWTNAYSKNSAAYTWLRFIERFKDDFFDIICNFMAI